MTALNPKPVYHWGNEIGVAATRAEVEPLLCAHLDIGPREARGLMMRSCNEGPHGFFITEPGPIEQMLRDIRRALGKEVA